MNAALITAHTTNCNCNQTAFEVCTECFNPDSTSVKSTLTAGIEHAANKNTKDSAVNICHLVLRTNLAQELAQT